MSRWHVAALAYAAILVGGDYPRTHAIGDGVANRVR